jgi:hypothetical protein
MKKRIIDLSPDELDKFASEAWGDAARQAFAQGLPVTGSRDGRRLRYYPDGRVEDLGPVASADASDTTDSKKARKSVA